jgi:hypothetical protein
MLFEGERRYTRSTLHCTEHAQPTPTPAPINDLREPPESAIVKTASVLEIRGLLFCPVL